MFPKARLLNKTTGFAVEKNKNKHFKWERCERENTRKTITIFFLLKIALPRIFYRFHSLQGQLQ